MASKRDLTPPAAVARNAARGLELRAQFKRGGTDVGVKRAEGLAASTPVSEADITTIASYFARHAVDRDGKAHVWGDEADPSAGYIAWLLWGGDEGRDWADAAKQKFINQEDR